MGTYQEITWDIEHQGRAARPPVVVVGEVTGTI